MLLLGLAAMPYGYYTLLRLVVFLTAGVGAYLAYTTARTGWTVALGIVALIYNPLFRVYLSRDAWEPVNVLTAALLLLCLWQLRRGMWQKQRAAHPASSA